MFLGWERGADFGSNCGTICSEGLPPPVLPNMTPVDQLPEDTKILKELIADLFDRLQKKEGEAEQLRHQLQVLLRSRYGRKAETIGLGQLMLFEQANEPVEATEAKAGIEQKTEAETKKHGRRKLACELPRKRVIYELDQEQLACPDCGDTRRQIGEEASEQYDYIPASVTVIEHVRCKYACPKCEGHVVIARGPNKPVEKGSAAAGMLAYIATSKFADHLPLHRLEGIFKRQGAIIARSTMCDWMAATAAIVQPVYECMKQRVLNSKIIWTDDTPVKLQDRDDERNMREARIWVYIGDRENKFTVYDFTDSRRRDGPKAFLSGFKGYLQADAFAGYNCVYIDGKVLEVACMAHARRKFYECLNSDARDASEILAMIQELYRIERNATDLDVEERRKMRLAESAPILYKMKRWLIQKKICSLPKSPLGKAITYALNNWKALCRYLKDGELTIDNNRSERAMRTIAVGRKNWLFAGSKEGGKNAAIISSLIATCKEHKINPQQYLLDVLTRLSSGETDLAKLLPDDWAPVYL